MKTNPLNRGASNESFSKISTVTRDMVHIRASELAVIEGRSPKSATMSDLAQAKRELMGEQN
jgi:hypothetical protein